MAAKDADVGLENSVEIAIPNAPVESRNAKVATVIHKSFVKENVSLINAKTSIRRIVRRGLKSCARKSYSNSLRRKKIVLSV